MRLPVRRAKGSPLMVVDADDNVIAVAVRKPHANPHIGYTEAEEHARAIVEALNAAGGIVDEVLNGASPSGSGKL